MYNKGRITKIKHIFLHLHQLVFQKCPPQSAKPIFLPEGLDIIVTASKTSQYDNSDKEVIGGWDLRMQEFSLPMSPGEGSFVTNTGDEVGTFGDSPVDVHKDAEEPDENVKLGVGLSMKSVSGRHTKNSPTEILLSPAVHKCERPR